MRKFKDEIKTMDREELEYWVMNLYENLRDFEKCMIKELGEVTYKDIVKRHMKEKIEEDIKDWGLTEKEKKRFLGFMYEEDEVIN